MSTEASRGLPPDMPPHQLTIRNLGKGDADLLLDGRPLRDLRGFWLRAGPGSSLSLCQATLELLVQVNNAASEVERTDAAPGVPQSYVDGWMAAKARAKAIVVDAINSGDVGPAWILDRLTELSP